MSESDSAMEDPAQRGQLTSCDSSIKSFSNFHLKTHKYSLLPKKKIEKKLVSRTTFYLLIRGINLSFQTFSDMMPICFCKILSFLRR